jgi:hypothetical protein
MARDIVGGRKRDNVQLFVDRLPFQVLQMEGGEVEGAQEPCIPLYQTSGLLFVSDRFSGNALSQLDFK